MKPILKSKTKLPLSIKLMGVFVFLIAVISSILSIRYSLSNKTEYLQLIEDSQLPSPQCLSKGGFHNSSFSITLISSTPNTKIYYTLDGSEPSLESKIYNLPITITNRTNESNTLSNIPTSPRWKPPVGDLFKGTVIRAITVTKNNKKSSELNRTFFIDEKDAKRYSLPIIALTVNPDDLFGYKNGIYVMGKDYEDKKDYIRKKLPLDIPWWNYPSNYLKRGNNSERHVYIEFYEPDGSIGFEENAGIRINGSATRGFAQKSLRICFNKKYGVEQLHYHLFKDTIGNFNSFILRNSGNDWSKTMFRDAFMQSLMSNFNLNIQSYRPAIVFINAEYWGIHNIREHFDENYLANKYNINTDSITILELNGNLFYGKKNDGDEFTKLLQYIRTNNMSQEINYDHIKKLMDIDNFIDYIIANVYFCNSDWPNNNVKFWRYKATSASPTPMSNNIKDGRWRWVLIDTDWGFGYTGADAVTIDLLEKVKKTGSIGVIFDALLKNKEFVNQFSRRVNYHIKNTFKPNIVIDRINNFQKTLNPEIQEHINRWRVIGSYTNWQDNVQELKSFASLRPDLQIQQLQSFIENKKK